MQYMKLSKLIFLTLLSPVALASTKSTVSFTLDNDGIFGVDQDYTNGIFFSYATEKLKKESEWKWFSLENADQSNIDKIEVVLGHKMWTPSDIEADYPLANDRPYAGYLHTEINYLSLTADQAVRYNFTIGATGESSLSEKRRKLFTASLVQPILKAGITKLTMKLPLALVTELSINSCAVRARRRNGKSLM